MNSTNGVNLDEEVDMTDVPDPNEFPTVPTGDYHVGVTRQQWTISKNGNSMLEFEIQVLTGDYAGFLMIDRIVFSPGGLKNAKAVLIHLGDQDMTTPKFKLRQVNLVGKQAIASIIHFTEEYQNRPVEKNEVKGFTGYSRPEGFQYVQVQGVPAPQATPPQQQQPPAYAPQGPQTYTQTAVAYAAPPVASSPPPQYQQPMAPPPPPPPPPPPTPYQMSPDGQWSLVNGQWVPAAQVTPPPPPPPQAPPAPMAAAAGQAPPRKDGLPF